MRRLNTSSITFEETDYVKKYDCAILSYYWCREQVSYEATRAHHLKQKTGYRKASEFCRVGKMQGFDRCCIDICCNDKKSSTKREWLKQVMLYLSLI
ncbi:hypothetical protein KC360_g89 [Hortaea werneckii]|nr:hypothetical protein KC344_g86 [Hortaea werneckii]KAI7180569.1 hypothetical protein KC360_g89 [Hortaea werneckii]